MVRGARLAVFVLIVGCIVGAPRAADACTCRSIPLCEAFSRTSAVFTGEVLEVMDEPSLEPPARRRVTLRVERMFRGAAAERLEVFTGSSHADCGYPFKRGEKYLVFAGDVGGQLRVTICSPTRPLAVASKQLDQLTGECAGQPLGLLVRGSIVRPNSRSASGVKVAIYRAGPNGSRDLVGSATSDRRGAFSIRLPAGGRYLVVGNAGEERGEVGPFELTEATAPVLIVIRRPN